MERASEITGISVDKIKQAAEMIAKPNPDGSRKKTSYACYRSLPQVAPETQEIRFLKKIGFLRRFKV